MKKTSRTTITCETERFLVLNHVSGAAGTWCAECAAAVKMISIVEAALLAEVSQRAVFHALENSAFHFTESERGTLLVCLDSLMNYYNLQRLCR